ncbi:MAG TPA: hypothetical protein PK264_15345, partial [Hyphomicrobiaceae bacterium]|nr:hypothetical protein [Hyphomicrobiaceae bacterium]
MFRVLLAVHGTLFLALLASGCASQTADSPPPLLSLVTPSAPAPPARETLVPVALAASQLEIVKAGLRP